MWGKGKEERGAGDYLLTAHSRRGKPAEGPGDQKWPEVCKISREGGATLGRWTCRAKGAGTGCGSKRCPHSDRFCVLACFDDEERSESYAERVGRCPECGAWLDARALSAGAANP